MAYQDNHDPVTDASSVSYRSVVHAMFRDPEFAAKAVGALVDTGVDPHDISILIKDAPPGWNPKITGPDLLDQATKGLTTTTGKDAAIGAMAGAGIGLGLGSIAALAALAIPGVGLVIGGGALLTAIAGAVGVSAAGAVSGAVYGFLKDQGTDETLAMAAEQDFQKGGALVSVTSPSGNVSTDTVNKVLAKYQEDWYMVHQKEEEDTREVESGTRVYIPFPPRAYP
jgi:hypothetical protein